MLFRSAESPPRVYSLPLPDVQQHVSVEADFGLCQELAELDGVDSGYCLSWILAYPEAPLVPMFNNGRELSLREQYWLGVNPTVSNTFDLAVTRFAIDSETNLHLTVRMALNGAKMTALSGSVLKLRAKARLSDPEWTMLAQFSLTEASFDSAKQCSLVVPNPFGFIMAGEDPKALFFSWAVDPEDVRVVVRPLVNESAP